MAPKVEILGNNKVKINGRVVEIPEDQREFFDQLIQTAKDTSNDVIQERVTTADVDPAKQSRINLGYTYNIYKTETDEETGEERKVIDKVEFKSICSFDFITYTLRDAAGKVIRPKLS